MLKYITRCQVSVQYDSQSKQQEVSIHKYNHIYNQTKCIFISYIKKIKQLFDHLLYNIITISAFIYITLKYRYKLRKLHK